MKRALLMILALVLATGVAAKLFMTPPSPPVQEQPLAEQAPALPLLAQAREKFLGLNGAKDEKNGATLVRQAADSGDMQAVGLLGVLYLGGIGVEQNFDEALKWLAKSTEQEGRDLYTRMQGFMSALEKLPPEEKKKQMDSAKTSAQTDMREALMKALEKETPPQKQGE